jgi:hypothetical protein
MMTRAILLYLITHLSFALAYPSFEDATQTMRQLAKSSEGQIRHTIIGQSALGRPIDAFEFGQGDEVVFINGCHHGNEKASVEVALRFIHLAATLQKGDQRIIKILRKIRVVVVPFVNPDGYVANTRFNSEGFDINRDYPFPERSEEESFSLTETRVIRDFLQQIKPRAALALHSGSEGVFWPWAYTEEAFVLPGLFAYLSSAFHGCTKRRMQSNEDYATQGEFIDYAFMRYGTWALTVEVSPYFSPPAEIMQPLAFRASLAIFGFLDRVAKVLEL